MAPTALPASIAARWRELNGQNDWKGLLDPLDIDLRYHIIHYSELTEAVGDSLISETKSPLTGLPRYRRENVLARSTATLGQDKLYKVTKYIYATAGSDSLGNALVASFFVKSKAPEAQADETNWMGYVAVATDEGVKTLGRRDVLVVWRGTVFPLEWGKDGDFLLAPASPILPNAFPEPLVHRGFKFVLEIRYT